LQKHAEIKQVDIAAAIGLTPQTLGYQLFLAKKFDTGLRSQIFHYFKTKGIYNGATEECLQINKIGLEFASLMNQQLGILGNMISDKISDGKITQTERDELERQIHDMRESFQAECERLHDIIRG